MFITNGQFLVFVACVSFGAFSGILFLPNVIIKQFFNVKLLNYFLDFIVFIIISLLFVIYQNSLKFPSIRGYMIAGCLLGLYSYFKSFNIILANLVKKIYNSIKAHKGRRKNGRTKTQKST